MMPRSLTIGISEWLDNFVIWLFRWVFFIVGVIIFVRLCHWLIGR
jgi:hypothetical protein